jgi:hypothetical protein
MAFKDYFGSVLLVGNRYYIGQKRHRYLFIANCVIFMVLAVSVVLLSGREWMIIAVFMGYIGLSLLFRHFIYDKFMDKLYYHLFGKRFETDHKIDDITYSAIKDLEKNPDLVHDTKTHKILQR